MSALVDFAIQMHRNRGYNSLLLIWSAANFQEIEKTESLANMIAGVVAGTAEGITVVTPGDNLKTKIVDDRAGPRQFRSPTHALRTIIATDGPSGLYRGALPVTLKQGSNSLVRFTAYSVTLDAVGPFMEKSGNVGLAPAASGAIAWYCYSVCHDALRQCKDKNAGSARPRNVQKHMALLHQHSATIGSRRILEGNASSASQVERKPPNEGGKS